MLNSVQITHLKIQFLLVQIFFIHKVLRLIVSIMLVFYKVQECKDNLRRLIDHSCHLYFNQKVRINQ